jgi:hypothetical protein
LTTFLQCSHKADAGSIIAVVQGLVGRLERILVPQPAFWPLKNIVQRPRGVDSSPIGQAPNICESRLKLVPPGATFRSFT